MPAITVRDVPEATRNELAARAARSGRSLQEFLRSELISLADRPSPDDSPNTSGSAQRRPSVRGADPGRGLTAEGLARHQIRNVVCGWSSGKRRPGSGSTCTTSNAGEGPGRHS